MPTTYDVHIPTTDREEKADIDLAPTAAMRAAANRALEWRREYGRGGTPVGVARARDIANGKQLSRETVARMVSFFARHGNNRGEHYELRDGKPTTWRIAWDLWGGDAGRAWAKAKWKKLRVIKFNPHHDELGRFASGGGGTISRGGVPSSIGENIESNVRGLFFEGMNKSESGLGNALLSTGSFDVFNKSTQATAKSNIVDQISQDTGIDKALVNNAIHQWAETSNDESYASLDMQRIAAKEFGVELSSWQQSKLGQVEEARDKQLEVGQFKTPTVTQRSVFETSSTSLEPGAAKYSNKDEATSAFLHSMYSNTQAKLKDQGIEKITVYRGIQSPELSGLKKGEVIKINGNAMESWSLHPKVAKNFAGGDTGLNLKRGKVLAMEVPASRILSTAKTGFGCLNEWEVVVLGGNNMGDALVVR